jgi:hypothetical protein
MTRKKATPLAEAIDALRPAYTSQKARRRRLIDEGFCSTCLAVRPEPSADGKVYATCQGCRDYVKAKVDPETHRRHARESARRRRAAKKGAVAPKGALAPKKPVAG